MAIFGWKKKDDSSAATPGKDGAPPASTAQNAAPGAGAFELNPEKGRKWFDHARNQHDIGNFEYAMTCWLSGLRFDPGNLEAVKAFTASAAAYKNAPSKEILRAIAGKTDVDRYLSALLEWACKPLQADLASAAFISAAGLNMTAVAEWMGPSALKVAMADPKPRKSTFIKLMETFVNLKMYDLGVRAGEAALKVDPTDNPLSAYVRNLAAQSTMSKGGYENTGKEGGFRSNVRDSDKQRMLEEEDRLSRSSGTVERLIEATEAEHKANPADKPTIKKLARLYLERGRPEDESAAIGLLEKAYASTQEFLFRQTAGEVRVRQAKRLLKPLQAAAEANPADGAAKAAFESARKALLDLEIGEYEARVAAYPTDLGLKFALGQRYAEAGRHSDAIAQFQLAQGDLKIRVQVQNAMGGSFLALGWLDEAIGTYRAALEGATDQNAAVNLDLRYGLMAALMQRATENKDLPSAEEANKLASAISMQNISFRDIRERREALRRLLTELKGGA